MQKGSKKSCLSTQECKRYGFRVRKEPLEEEMATHSSILTWSLVSHRPWGCKSGDMTLATAHAHITSDTTLYLI